MSYVRKRPPKPGLYPGKLNEPLEPRVSLPPMRSDEYPEDVAPPQAGEESDWRPEYDEKLNLLCDFFSIGQDDPERWKKLALALAKNHVRGFQEKQPETRGRRSKEDLSRDFVLWHDFISLVRNGETEFLAAKILLANYPDLNFSERALVSRLKRFEKRLREEFRRWQAQRYP